MSITFISEQNHEFLKHFCEVQYVVLLNVFALVNTPAQSSIFCEDRHAYESSSSDKACIFPS